MATSFVAKTEATPPPGTLPVRPVVCVLLSKRSRDQQSAAALTGPVRLLLDGETLVVDIFRGFRQIGTKDNPARHDRSKLRGRSDVRHEECDRNGRLILPAKSRDNTCTVDEPATVNRAIDIIRFGWRQGSLPNDLPRRSTTNDCPPRRHHGRTLDPIHRALSLTCRQLAAGAASPIAAVVDRQSAKAAEKRALDRYARLRRRQPDQGQEPAYPGRHADLRRCAIIREPTFSAPREA